MHGETILRAFRYLLIALVLMITGWLLLSFLVLLPALESVDQAYYSIPQAASRNEVREILNKFKEEPSSISSIPEAYRSGLPVGTKVFRYFYVMPMFSIYVLYDEDGRVLMKIPTYE